MFFGKFWLMPDGQVVDVTTGEHIVVARDRMLNLPPGRINEGADNFRTFSQAEYDHHLARGVNRDVLDFLLRGGDARRYAIEHWGWIRVRQDRFHLWVLNAKSAGVIARAAPYWAAQSQAHQYEILRVIEWTTGRQFDVPRRVIAKPAGIARAKRRWELHGALAAQ